MAGFEVLDIINEPTAAAVAFGFQRGYLDPQRQQPRPAAHPRLRPRRRHVRRDGDANPRHRVQRPGDRRRRAARRLRLGHAAGGSGGRAVRRRARLRPAGRSAGGGQAAAGLRRREADPLGPAEGGRDLRLPRHDRADRGRPADSSRRPRPTSWTGRGSRRCRRLRAAGLDWADLDRVLLVGGSTRMPMVRQMLRRAFRQGARRLGGRRRGGRPRRRAARLADPRPRSRASRRGSRFATSIRTAWAWWASIRRPSAAATASSSRETRRLPVASKRVFHTKTGRPAVDRRRYRRGRERLAGGLLADRPLLDPRPAGRTCRRDRRSRSSSATSPTAGSASA